LRDVLGAILHELGRQIGQHASGGQFVADLRDRPVARVAPGVGDALVPLPSSVSRTALAVVTLSVSSSLMKISTFHCFVSIANTSTSKTAPQAPPPEGAFRLV
jgi:hypothetical protein